ncbi:hypothetical protein J6590_052828 [Homalodisca vitripennis]|nr:hypothetical protein J6590_052828 [Homalodisca vitripennis]
MVWSTAKDDFWNWCALGNNPDVAGRGWNRPSLFFFKGYETEKHPRYDGGGERGKAASGDEAVNSGREEVPVGSRERRCGFNTETSVSVCHNRMMQRAQETDYININCVDPLGRSALLMAIDNENLEMVELLIEYKVDTKDALLHAISEEFVEAVEVLLDHEETLHKPGEPHSWEALPPDTATFTPDITPLILAAHRDNYEIIKILLDRGATLPMPHDVRCGCDECVTFRFETPYDTSGPHQPMSLQSFLIALSCCCVCFGGLWWLVGLWCVVVLCGCDECVTYRFEDSLRHSRSRINVYRALASPSFIALSCN